MCQINDLLAEQKYEQLVTRPHRGCEEETEEEELQMHSPLVKMRYMMLCAECAGLWNGS